MYIEDRLESIDASLKNIERSLNEGISLFHSNPPANVPALLGVGVVDVEAQQKALDAAVATKRKADDALLKTRAKAAAEIPKGMKVEESEEEEDDLTAEEEKPAEKPTGKEFSQADVVLAVRLAVAKEHRDEVKALLTKYGAKRAPHVKEEDFSAFMAEIKPYLK